MNTILLLAFVAAMLIGFFDGIGKMNATKNNPSLGVEPSKNIFTYLFCDRY